MENKSRRARQGILALTQTEIMFVFAAIILILLQREALENRDLEREYAHLSGAQDTVVGAAEEGLAPGHEPQGALAPEESPTAARPSGEAEPDLDSPVDKVLTRDNSAAGAAGSPAGGEPSLEAARDDPPAGSGDAGEAVDAPVDGVLRRARAAGVIPDSGTDLEQAEELYRLARVGKGAEEAALRRDYAGKVGFNPCWPKTDGGALSYHYTFDTEYDRAADRFRLRAAWNDAAPLARIALGGGMSILADHPRGWISREQFAEYGREVAARAAVTYPAGCRLVTKINDAGKEAVLFVAQFFYPIYD